jgi:hypothetical protein
MPFRPNPDQDPESHVTPCPRLQLCLQTAIAFRNHSSNYTYMIRARTLTDRHAVINHNLDLSTRTSRREPFLGRRLPGGKKSYGEQPDWMSSHGLRLGRHSRRDGGSNDHHNLGIQHSLTAQIVFGSRMEGWQLTRIMQCATAFEMTQSQFLRSLRRAALGLLRITPENVRLRQLCWQWVSDGGLRLFGRERVDNRRPSGINPFEDESVLLDSTIHEKSLRHTQFVRVHVDRLPRSAANKMVNFLSLVTPDSWILR